MAKDTTRAQRPARLRRSLYEDELYRLQAELVTMQEWVRDRRARVLIIFEGRDAAGKGSAIKRVAQYLNPRIARIVALPAPTERERGQWYFQRYVAHLPTAGEIVLMDRSWYNRAGVERVMGFCTPDEYRRFIARCPVFERMLVDDGILFESTGSLSLTTEQERRFTMLTETTRSTLEAVADGCRVHSAVGGLLAGQGRDVDAHRYRGGPWWTVEATTKGAHGST